jgi:hypothetical protein
MCREIVDRDEMIGVRVDRLNKKGVQLDPET